MVTIHSLNLFRVTLIHLSYSGIVKLWHPVVVTLHALKVRSLLSIYYTGYCLVLRRGFDPLSLVWRTSGHASCLTEYWNLGGGVWNRTRTKWVKVTCATTTPHPNWNPLTKFSISRLALDSPVVPIEIDHANYLQVIDIRLPSSITQMLERELG